MRIDIISGFPRMLEAPLNESIVRQARLKNRVQIHIHDLRDFTEDKHRTIDDYPYGGGPGMVLKLEPIVKALRHIFKEEAAEKARILLTSPRGQTLNQSTAVKLSLQEHLVLICGHYKGVDERLGELFDVQELSIGDYVLSAGETAALVIVDAVVRLLPGVIKDINSAWSDSFSDDLLDAPYYTRPENFEGHRVPPVLLSGDHKKIENWRLQQREEITRRRRPELFKKYLKP